MPYQSVKRDLTRDKTLRARKLRRQSSVAETQVWKLLRKDQTGFSFRRQHAIGIYVLDFYCAEARLAVEFDGEQHDAERDKIRDDYFRSLGIETFRVSNRQLYLLDGSFPINWYADLIALCEARTGRRAFPNVLDGQSNANTTSDS